MSETKHDSSSLLSYSTTCSSYDSVYSIILEDLHRLQLFQSNSSVSNLITITDICYRIAKKFDSNAIQVDLLHTKNTQIIQVLLSLISSPSVNFIQTPILQLVYTVFILLCSKPLNKSNLTPNSVYIQSKKLILLNQVLTDLSLFHLLPNSDSHSTILLNENHIEAVINPICSLLNSIIQIPSNRNNVLKYHPLVTCLEFLLVLPKHLSSYETLTKSLSELCEQLFNVEVKLNKENSLLHWRLLEVIIYLRLDSSIYCLLQQLFDHLNGKNQNLDLLALVIRFLKLNVNQGKKRNFQIFHDYPAIILFLLQAYNIEENVETREDIEHILTLYYLSNSSSNNNPIRSLMNLVQNNIYPLNTKDPLELNSNNNYNQSHFSYEINSFNKLVKFHSSIVKLKSVALTILSKYLLFQTEESSISLKSHIVRELLQFTVNHSEFSLRVESILVNYYCCSQNLLKFEWLLDHNSIELEMEKINFKVKELKAKLTIRVLNSILDDIKSSVNLKDNHTSSTVDQLTVSHRPISAQFYINSNNSSTPLIDSIPLIVQRLKAVLPLYSSDIADESSSVFNQFQSLYAELVRLQTYYFPLLRRDLVLGVQPSDLNPVSTLTKETMKNTSLKPTRPASAAVNRSPRRNQYMNSNSKTNQQQQQSNNLAKLSCYEEKIN